jgi:diguanylate cyclase (GGDEF)-like protein
VRFARLIDAIARRRVVLVAGSVAWIAVAAYLDVRTGDAAVAPLYLVPVGLLAWSLGLGAGIAAAAFATAAAMGLTLLRDELDVPGLSVWNGAAILVMGSALAAALARIRRDQRRVAALLESEQRLAREDALTGLATSRAFYERFSHEIERMKRHGRPLALLYLDLDDFKQVNDARGHRAGDQVLEAVGQTLRGCVRRVDMAARIGGDEFIVLMPETEPEDAAGVARRVRDAILRRFRETGPRVGVSAGLGTFAHPPTDPEMTIHLVDQLMYEAKRAGKNRIVDRVFA